jgi:hypothetical protein
MQGMDLTKFGSHWPSSFRGEDFSSYSKSKPLIIHCSHVFLLDQDKIRIFCARPHKYQCVSDYCLTPNERFSGIS